MHTLRNIIPEDRSEIADRLNEILAAALFFEDLYKRYHWMVTGPHFLPLHQMFDDHMETLEHEIDDFGERIRVLDGTPVWNPERFARQTVLPAPDETLNDDLAIAREAFEMEAAYADALRQAANSLGDDLATQDLVVEYLRVHDKQAWFLREFIRKVRLESYEAETFENGH